MCQTISTVYAFCGCSGATVSQKCPNPYSSACPLVTCPGSDEEHQTVRLQCYCKAHSKQGFISVRQHRRSESRGGEEEGDRSKTPTLLTDDEFETYASSPSPSPPRHSPPPQASPRTPAKLRKRNWPARTMIPEDDEYGLTPYEQFLRHQHMAESARRANESRLSLREKSRGSCTIM